MGTSASRWMRPAGAGSGDSGRGGPGGTWRAAIPATKRPGAAAERSAGGDEEPPIDAHASSIVPRISSFGEHAAERPLGALGPPTQGRNDLGFLSFAGRYLSIT